MGNPLLFHSKFWLASTVEASVCNNQERKCIMLPAFPPQTEIITLEQYETLPESRRVEVFEGSVYDMASPSQVHQALSMELSNILYNYIKNKKGACQVFHAPFDVKLSDKPLTIVQPDIMVICDKDKLDGKRCNGSPDFIIEIVSSGNPSDDYIRKLYPLSTEGIITVIMACVSIGLLIPVERQLR